MASLFGMTLNSLPSWLGGGGPTKADVPPLQGQPYPSQADVRRSHHAATPPMEATRRRSFSRLSAGRSPRRARAISSRTPSIRLDTGQKNTFSPQQAVSPAVSDSLMAGYLASQRSALAALGFDPRHMAIGDAPPEQWSVGKTRTTRRGTRSLSFRDLSPSTAAHEKNHARDRDFKPGQQKNARVRRLVPRKFLFAPRCFRNFGGCRVGAWQGGRRANRFSSILQRQSEFLPDRRTPPSLPRRSSMPPSIREVALMAQPLPRTLTAARASERPQDERRSVAHICGLSACGPRQRTPRQAVLSVYGSAWRDGLRTHDAQSGTVRRHSCLGWAAPGTLSITQIMMEENPALQERFIDADSLGLALRSSSAAIPITSVFIRRQGALLTPCPMAAFCGLTRSTAIAMPSLLLRLTTGLRFHLGWTAFTSSTAGPSTHANKAATMSADAMVSSARRPSAGNQPGDPPWAE